MSFILFAGPIFSPGEVVFIYITLFVTAGIFAGMFVYLITSIMSRSGFISKTYKNKLFKAMVFGFGIIAIAALALIVIPTRIEDSNRVDKSIACAKEAGYSDPAEDNSTTATHESQLIYRNCMDAA